ncbi:DUF5672 family protein [Burkholderia sp. Ax-1719]|uniref:DUF5672 family protein n=1 Tax=Burkholderia sp. Ax-1719 TaxID=2608334 RepID=UPI0014230C69|nr:DUF5672 family protein [Burkholderia sp. Ax-1719]NIE64538.1 hypothetical protein [Burkholderia sp. Ax-1719]
MSERAFDVHSPSRNLRDVTLCAVDTVNPKLAARALDISLSQCDFGDAMLIADVDAPTRARIEKIAALRSLAEYSHFMLKRLADYIATPWVLVVQWDGYVLDASRWSDRFYQYDYIGARWPNSSSGNDVGNGGFSLRSAKLLKALANDRFSIDPGAAEDVLIGSTWREALEAEHGIRFAPGDVADEFAYEYGVPRQPTFGFHGFFNMWRHVEDSVMLEIIDGLDIQTLASPRGVALLKNYCDLRKFACVRAMYRRYRAHLSVADVAHAFARNGLSDDAAREYVNICERS